MDGEYDNTSVPMPQESLEVKENETNQISTLTHSNPVEQNSTIAHAQSVDVTKSNRRSNSQLDQYVVGKDDLLYAYIGPNCEKILKRPFNIAAFFFTVCYYFYRKMTLYGILLLIAESALLYFFYSKFYLLLIVNLLCGLLTNKIYVNFSVRKTNKIIENNISKSLLEIKGMCSALGGRSFKRVVVFAIWNILSIIPIAFFIIFTQFSTEVVEYIKNFDFNDINFTIKQKDENNEIISGEDYTLDLSTINDKKNQ